MQIRLLKSQIEDITENANWDTGDHSWWVSNRIEQAIDATLELIKEHVDVAIVPEEKYLKCECQFKPKMVNDKYGYHEIYEHTSYCKEHEDENPELYKNFGHRKECTCCGE